MNNDYCPDAMLEPMLEDISLFFENCYFMYGSFANMEIDQCIKSVDELNILMAGWMDKTCHYFLLPNKLNYVRADCGYFINVLIAFEGLYPRPFNKLSNEDKRHFIFAIDTIRCAMTDHLVRFNKEYGLKLGHNMLENYPGMRLGIK